MNQYLFKSKHISEALFFEGMKCVLAALFCPEMI